MRAAIEFFAAPPSSFWIACVVVSTYHGCRGYLWQRQGTESQVKDGWERAAQTASQCAADAAARSAAASVVVANTPAPDPSSIGSAAASAAARAVADVLIATKVQMPTPVVYGAETPWQTFWSRKVNDAVLYFAASAAGFVALRGAYQIAVSVSEPKELSGADLPPFLGPPATW